MSRRLNDSNNSCNSFICIAWGTLLKIKKKNEAVGWFHYMFVHLTEVSEIFNKLTK